MKFFLRSLLLVFFLPASSFAARDTQYWTNVILRKNLPDSPWWMAAEGTYRHSVNEDTPVIKSIRFWGGYKLSFGTELGVFNEWHDTNRVANDEKRLGIQASHKWNFQYFDLQGRLRQEARRFTDSSTVQQRTRVQGRVDATVLTYFDVTPFVSCEWFYISNDVGPRVAGAQEFRNVLGVSYAPNSHWKFDLGYMDRRQITKNVKGVVSDVSFDVATLTVTAKF